MVERVIRTLKEQCAHRHRFETQQHAMRVIGDWIAFYNHRRPHQALGMKTPAEAYALAAQPVQEVLGHYRPAYWAKACMRSRRDPAACRANKAMWTSIAMMTLARRRHLPCCALQARMW